MYFCVPIFLSLLSILTGLGCLCPFYSDSPLILRVELFSPFCCRFTTTLPTGGQSKVILDKNEIIKTINPLLLSYSFPITIKIPTQIFNSSFSHLNHPHSFPDDGNFVRVTFTVRACSNVEALKDQIQKSFSISSKNIRLVCDGRNLSNSHSFYYYSINSSSSIYYIHIQGTRRIW